MREKTLEEKPVDDSHLPRRERRFPLRAINDSEQAEVRAQINQILCGIDDMMWKIVRRGLPRGTPHDVLDECVQELRVHLALRSLPKFDAHRGAKVTTFAYRCCQFYVSNARKVIRRRRRCSYCQSLGNTDREAPDQFHDRAVEAMADHILRDPDLVGFTPAEARAVKAVIDAEPGTSRRAISSMLGYASDTTFCNLIRRASDRIRNLDIVIPDGPGESKVN